MTTKLVITPSASDNCINFIYEDNARPEYPVWDLFTEELIMEMEKYENVRLMHMNNIQVSRIPKNIVKLCLYECLEFNEPLDMEEFVNLEEFHLEFSELFMQPLDKFPQTLKKLSISSEAIYTYPICNLPKNLKSLHLNLYCPENSSIELQIPPNLEEFEISWDMDLNNIPDSIKKLSLFSANQKPISKLPANLETIKFGHYYTKYNNNNFLKILDLIRELENARKCKINIEFYGGDTLPLSTF